jgi:hypothetical protein
MLRHNLTRYLNYFLLFLLLVGAVAVYLYLPFHRDSSIHEEVMHMREGCEADSGILVEGINRAENNDVNHFYVCIPAELYTCIDVD